MDRVSRERWVFVVLAGGLSLAGIVILLLMTRWGIGTSPDSVQYIKSARQLMDGMTSGVSTDTGIAGTRHVALAHHAPLYSFLLAGGGLVGLDPLDGARWLNALLFGMNIFLVAFIVRSSSRHCAWTWGVASLVILSSLPVLIIHATALTEPLFLFLSLSGFYLLAMYLERERQVFMLGAALAIGFAFLARYAGAAGIVTGAAAVLLFGRMSFRRRIRDSLLFGIVSVLPMVVWMLRNVSLANTATGRELYFHPIGPSHVWQAIYTASSWMLIPTSVPDFIRVAVLLALVAGLTVTLTRKDAEGTSTPRIVHVLALFVAVYGVFLATSISFFDANTPLDDRILLPVFAAGLIVVMHMVDSLWPISRRRPVAAYVAFTLLVAFVGAHMVKGSGGVSASYAGGWGFTSLAWQKSSTLAQVRTLPEGTLIYSNAPEIIYLHTGRESRPLPKTQFLMSQQSNVDFSVQLEEVGRDLRAGCGVVVYFRHLQQKSVASEHDLKAQLSLRVRADTVDGSVLGAIACPQ